MHVGKDKMIENLHFWTQREKKEVKPTFMFSSIAPHTAILMVSNTLASQAACTHGDKDYSLVLQDPLCTYLYFCEVDYKQIKDFKKWLEDNDIDEDAMMQDLGLWEEESKKKDKQIINLAAESNLIFAFKGFFKNKYQDIYEKVENFIKTPKSLFCNADNFQSRPIYRSARFLPTLRYATHQYYTFDPNKETFLRLEKETKIDPANHHLIQLTCQVAHKPKDKIQMYCFFPEKCNITFQGLTKHIAKPF